MDFNEYLAKVKSHFGDVSKEFIIASLYNLSGFRDDLILKIIAVKPKDDKENYIIIPKDKKRNLSIELNNYKTSGKYGHDSIPIPKDLSKLIRQYIDDANLEYDDYLFGSKSLSGFIKKFNEKMGLNISINKLRQMRVSNVLNNNPTVEQRVKLSKEMKHKALTSEKYQRKTIVV
jgi:hypothetical protein